MMVHQIESTVGIRYKTSCTQREVGVRLHSFSTAKDHQPEAMPSTHAHSRRDVMEGLPPPSSEEDTPAPLPDERSKLPRPTDDVGEPAHKINRSEIAAENKFATEAVRWVLLRRLKCKQVEDNPLAEEALGRFVDACAKRRVTKEHQYLAWTLIDRLGSQDVGEKDVDAIVTEAIEAGTGIRRTCLFDGPSIDFPLGNSEKVKVLVREGTTISSRDSPLFGHSEMQAYGGNGAIEIARMITGRFNPLALISGASGRGKTVCGISVVAHLRRFDSAAGACLRIRCGADWFTFSPDQEPRVPLKELPLFSSRDPKGVFDIHAFEETYKSAHEARDERDMVAEHFVLQAIDKVITWHHRKEPTEGRCLVVFLDDAGEYPTFVLAMCSRFDALQSIINDRYSNGKCRVRVIMAGIGIVGEDHRCGSEPPTIFRYTVQPRAGREAAPELPNV
jgi:hypothetical protein